MSMYKIVTIPTPINIDRHKFFSGLTISEEKQFEIQKQAAEAQLKGQLMEKEFNYSMQLQGMTQEQLGIREEDREKAKSNRISQQNTEQSELINQRINNLPPKNFESAGNDILGGGFDLGAFDPRSIINYYYIILWKKKMKT